MTYLFYGGLPHHSKRGQKCIKLFQFTSNPKYWMVEFEDKSLCPCSENDLKIENFEDDIL